MSFLHPYDSFVDVAYKKVGDGHPLRLWKVTTEVEAPPQEVLHRLKMFQKLIIFSSYYCEDTKLS